MLSLHTNNKVLRTPLEETVFQCGLNDTKARELTMLLWSIYSGAIGVRLDHSDTDTSKRGFVDLLAEKLNLSVKDAVSFYNEHQKKLRPWLTCKKMEQKKRSRENIKQDGATRMYRPLPRESTLQQEEETTEEKFERINSEMRMKVLQYLEDDTIETPAVEEPVAYSEMEMTIIDFTKEATECARYPQKSPFDIFHDSLIPSEGYTPTFDRNDLFYTNVAELERILNITRVFLRIPDANKDLNRIPEFQIVTLTCGQQKYITWVLKTEYDTFINDVVNGRVICNKQVTECVRSGCPLRCEVIDVCGSVPLMSTIPARLAAIANYAIEYQCQSPDGLNVAFPPYSRHRLMYECVTPNVYRYIMLTRENKERLQTATREAAEHIKKCVSSLYTLLKRFYVLFCEKRDDVIDCNDDEEMATHLEMLQTSVIGEYTRALKCCADATESKHVLMQTGEKRRDEIQKVYGEATVTECRDGIPISMKVKRLMKLEMPTVPSEFGANEVACRQLQVLCERIENLPSVSVLKPLILLELWAPLQIPSFEHWSLDDLSSTAYLPLVRYGKQDVLVAYRRKCLQYHPDKGGDAAIQLKLNMAKEVLTGVYFI